MGPRLVRIYKAYCSNSLYRIMSSRGQGRRVGGGRGRSEVGRGKNMHGRGGRELVRERREICACEANTPLLGELRDLEVECSRLGKQNLRCGVRRAIRSVKLYPLPITTEAEACALEGVGSFTARRMLRCLPSRLTGETPAGSGDSRRGGHCHGPGTGDPSRNPSDQENVRPDTAPFENRAGNNQGRLPEGFCSSVDHRDHTLTRGTGGRRNPQITFSLAARLSALRRDGGCESGGVAGDGDDAADVTPKRPTSRVRREEEEVDDSSEALLPAPRFFSGSWEALLLVDNRERDFMSVKSALLQRGVLCQTRQLPLGDMLWVARRENEPASEVLLGFIVERKTPSDLASSIIDGRYEEQKRRLKLSGLRRCIYLVEGNLSHQSQLAPTALRTALASSQVHGGLAVVRSSSLRDTIDFLARTHRHVASLLRIACFSSSAITRPDAYDPRGTASVDGDDQCTNLASSEVFLRPVMTYGEYAQGCAKRSNNTTARQVLGAMVRQAPGCSAARAEAIVRAFDSPVGLMLAFERAAECGAEGRSSSNADRVKEGEDLLAGLRCGGDAGTNKLSQPLRRLLARLFLEESAGFGGDSGVASCEREVCAGSERVEVQDGSRDEGVYRLGTEDLYCSQP